MTMTRSKKILSLILCMVLIAAMALITTGCTGKTNTTRVTGSATFEDGDKLGKGNLSFTLTVVDIDGNESTCTVKTKKTFVGEALQELGVLEGEEGPYGLYIKTVNGITADYDTDGVYWAFYIDGEYAMTSADMTEIVDGSTYTFKVEK